VTIAATSPKYRCNIDVSVILYTISFTISGTIQCQCNTIMVSISGIKNVPVDSCSENGGSEY
jgi:hypothetical protein